MLVFASRTGNIVRFVEKLPPCPVLRIVDGTEQVALPCVLITYTTGFGQVPPEVQAFAAGNAGWIRGVAASGNRNWGNRFGRAADQIALQLGVPVVHKFELAGRPEDVTRFCEGVKHLALPGIEW